MPVRGLKQFERDLDKFLSPDRIGAAFVERFGKVLIQQLIADAHVGTGPGNTRYPPYSAEHLKVKVRKQGGAAGNFLRGPSRTGRRGGMLDAKRFGWKVNMRVGSSKGGAVLVWTAENAEMGIYAEVHNSGLPIGKGGPVKKREFMHFDTTAMQSIIAKGFEDTIDGLSAEFAQEWGGRVHG